MAVSPPELFNNWWVYLRDMVGGTYGTSWVGASDPSDYQIHNAYRMREELQSQGYDDKAIAGIIGNAMVESGISPGAIQKWSVLPNRGERLQDVPNSYMMQYYTPTAGGQGYGLGLLQWDRYSATYLTNDLLGWSNAYGYTWYDGHGQLARLAFEFNTDALYHFWRMNYGTMTWADYKNIETYDPSWDAGECANCWASCWELSSLDPTGRQHRRDNANWFYQYFIDHPIEPSKPNIVLLWMMKRRKELRTPCRRI